MWVSISPLNREAVTESQTSVHTTIAWVGTDVPPPPGTIVITPNWPGMAGRRWTVRHRVTESIGRRRGIEVWTTHHQHEFLAEVVEL